MGSCRKGLKPTVDMSHVSVSTFIDSLPGIGHLICPEVAVAGRALIVYLTREQQLRHVHACLYTPM